MASRVETQRVADGSWEICFEPINDELPGKIESEVRRAVSRWLSHIEITSVETLPQEGSKGNVFVKIKFIPALSSEELETVLNPTGLSNG